MLRIDTKLIKYNKNKYQSLKLIIDLKRIDNSARNSEQIQHSFREILNLIIFLLDSNENILEYEDPPGFLDNNISIRIDFYVSHFDFITAFRTNHTNKENASQINSVYIDMIKAMAENQLNGLSRLIGSHGERNILSYNFDNIRLLFDFLIDTFQNDSWITSILKQGEKQIYYMISHDT